jgi:outer membrane immunogenic protein
LIGLSGLASAADLYVKAPPVLYVPTWTGCYIGGHAGYGETTSSSQYTAAETVDFGGPGQFNQDFDNKALLGGGQAGCQLQSGTFLWGLEGDWSSFSNSSSRNYFYSFSEGPETISGSYNQSVSYSSLWSVRGRFGGIFSDVYHLYVTAGIGGAKAQYTSSASFSECDTKGHCGSVSTANNVGISPTGVVLGAGAEWKVWPSVVIGAEYLHYALVSDTALSTTGGSISGTPLSSLVGPGPGDHVHTESVDVIRFRASYLFNWVH